MLLAIDTRKDVGSHDNQELCSIPVLMGSRSTAAKRVHVCRVDIFTSVRDLVQIKISSGVCPCRKQCEIRLHKIRKNRHCDMLVFNIKNYHIITQIALFGRNQLLWNDCV